MATPLGHSIVGYLLARAAGVKSPAGLAMAISAASLPDADLLLGYVASSDPLSLHRETFTHKPAFPLLVGAATGLALVLPLGRRRTRGEALRPAALATGLVGAHLAMDALPLPYDTMSLRSVSLWQAIVTHAWNAVIDLTTYGALAMVALGRNRTSRREAEP